MNYRKVLLATFLISSGLGLPSCSDTELGIGIGAIIGGVIGHHYYENRDGYYRYDGYGRGDGHFRRYSDPLEMEAHQNEDVQLVAQKYQIRDEASRVIVVTLYHAQNQDYSRLQDLGLKNQDVMAIYNNQSVSQQTVQNVSQKLNMDVVDTAQLIEEITADVQMEKAHQARQQKGYQL